MHRLESSSFASVQNRRECIFNLLLRFHCGMIQSILEEQSLTIMLANKRPFINYVRT